MKKANQLEHKLHTLFVKQAPALPAGGKKFLVQFAPWLSLVGGLGCLYTAWNVWNWSHLYVSFGLGFGIWLGIAVLVAEGVMYLKAYPGLRDHKKSGWNLVYYALIINVVYGVIIDLTSYGTAGNLLFSLVGAAIGLYLLFQIRGTYLHRATADSTRPPVNIRSSED